jgi:hypothetical protein
LVAVVEVCPLEAHRILGKVVEEAAENAVQEIDRGTDRASEVEAGMETC